MLNVIIILLISFLKVVYCINVNTTHTVDNNHFKKVFSVINFSEHSIKIKTTTLPSFNSPNDFLWRRLDHIKQWKRRRRTVDYLKEEMNVTLKITDSSNNESDFNQNSLNSVVTTELNGSKSLLALISKFVERWPVQRWRKLGLFTDDYLLHFNRHWLQFPPPDSRIQYSLGGAYILLGSIGCFGNILVLLMYFRCRTLRTPGNILVANLALSDFLMLAKTPIFVYNSFNLGPALGESGCVVYGFVGGLSGTTSIATLSAIALDRYWAVVRPLEPLRALTAVRARILAVIAWLYACLFAIIPALNIGYGQYVPEGFLTSCSFDYLTEDFYPRCFIFVFFCAAWVAPFCTISFCYISIFRVVVCDRNMPSSKEEQRLSSRHVKERTKRKAEIKLAFLVMAVIALFFISWTPYAVVALLGITGKKELLTPITSMIPALFCKTAACINPFIYIITHPKFRKEFRKMFCREKTRLNLSSTIKTIGYYADTSRMYHQPSKDLSDTDVEVVEMKNIPYRTDGAIETRLETISSRVADCQDSQKCINITSFEKCIVNPPSWYSKPQFAKKRSFHRRSSHGSNISHNSLNI